MSFLESHSQGLITLRLSLPSDIVLFRRLCVFCLPSADKGLQCLYRHKLKGEKDLNKLWSKQQWEEKQAMYGLGRHGSCQKKKQICKNKIAVTHLLNYCQHPRVWYTVEINGPCPRHLPSICGVHKKEQVYSRIFITLWAARYFRGEVSFYSVI